MAQQRVCVVMGLQPSPFAFIHRRTGTVYVFHPNVGAFVAKVDQHPPFAYIDVASLEPWETVDNPPPGPELGDSQLQLPAAVAGLPGSPSENRRSPYYGHSETWRSIRPWSDNYGLLRGSMQRSAARRDASA